MPRRAEQRLRKRLRALERYFHDMRDDLAIAALAKQYVAELEHCRAIGYMSSGQKLIEGHIFAGHSPSVQDMAVKDVVDWLAVHRAGLATEVLPGLVPAGAFDPHPDA